MGDVAVAAVASYEESGIRFRWGVPSESVDSADSGSLYFSIDAPVTKSWASLGIGSGMRGSSMFLVYTDGKGNVTLSTRLGTGHRMPRYASDSGATLVAGSGVHDGRMVANVRCSGSCSSGLDLGGTDSWIAAWVTGDALDTDDIEAPISIHDGVGIFDVDLSQAGIASDSNPFLGGSTGDSGDDDTGAVTSGGGGQGGGGGESHKTMVSAHGFIMSVAFLILYPLGAMVMPLFGKWIAHSAVQMVAYLAMWAGFSLGIVISHGLPLFSSPHKGLGVILVALLGLQPAFGWLHHRHFLKNRRRGLVSHVHIWYGRALVLVGMVNGGLGLQMAHEEPGGGLVVAYSVVAGVMAAAYLGAVGIGILKRRRTKAETDSLGQPYVHVAEMHEA
ncbi:integral membrane protein [Geosmithia morbida]|uniref:Integral membrane protein n=1 Tax=Geosmithia morbida TaxID=1094350 RepID=A0A9P4YYI2_9HYPO|nr:uncharacterized protein GMORB2_5734 [Geosmithia morbida]KAF4124018.1 integral membrane protein [Geosmithia morbida]